MFIWENEKLDTLPSMTVNQLRIINFWMPLFFVVFFFRFSWKWVGPLVVLLSNVCACFFMVYSSRWSHKSNLWERGVSGWFIVNIV